MRCEPEIFKYGGDILKAPNMVLEKQLFQHGDVTCFRHSVAVAAVSLLLARALRLRLDERSLVRGALLHDYFLYDWHVPDRAHRLHGFTHAHRALENARRDFALNPVEENIIATHMFPLNLHPPGCRESAVVCCADKLCAARETARPLLRRLSGSKNRRGST